MRQVKYIVIHCTGGPQTQTLKSIKAYWKSIGWKNPGYCEIFNPDGSIDILTDVYSITNGVRGFNKECVHICYKGGVDDKGKIKDTRTDIVKEKMLRELYYLMGLFPDAKILGHRNLASKDINNNGIIDYWERVKACPSFDVYEWLDSVNFAFMANVIRLVA